MYKSQSKEILDTWVVKESPMMEDKYTEKGSKKTKEQNKVSKKIASCCSEIEREKGRKEASKEGGKGGREADTSLLISGTGIQEPYPEDSKE